MTLFTLGCSMKTQEQISQILRDNSIKRVIDIRFPEDFYNSHNVEFKEKCVKIDKLVPPFTVFNYWTRGLSAWDDFSEDYLKFLKQNRVEKLFEKDNLDGTCLVALYASAHKCHRRILAEYLQSQFPGLDVKHL